MRLKLVCQTIFVLEGISTLPRSQVALVERMRQRVGHSGEIPASLTAVLTRDPDDRTLPSDRRIAIANLILDGGGLQAAGDPARLARAIEAVRDHRRKRYPDRIFLVTEVSRSIRPRSRRSALRTLGSDEFSVVFEGANVEVMATFRDHAHQLEMALFGALRLDLNDDLRYEEVTSTTYSIQPGGRTEYRMSFQMGIASIRVSSNVTNDDAQRLSRSVRRRLRREDLVPLSLVGRASLIDQDETVEFLVAFTALEQHIRARIGSGTLRQQFRRVMAQRRLSATDGHEFDALYAVRNALAHEGETIVGRGLASRVRKLLKRCTG